LKKNNNGLRKGYESRLRDVFQKFKRQIQQKKKQIDGMVGGGRVGKEDHTSIPPEAKGGGRKRKRGRGIDKGEIS